MNKPLEEESTNAKLFFLSKNWCYKYMKKYCIFIFRRDLRIKDNTCLNYCMSNYENVIPVFIFTPEQIVKNKYKSENAIQFMIESLKELNDELKKAGSKLHLFKGKNETIIRRIIRTINVEAIAYNKDYTPYSLKRDNSISKICKNNDIECVELEDYLLHCMGSLNKDDGEPYRVFTPFKNNGLKKKVNKPSNQRTKNLTRSNKLKTISFPKYKINPSIHVNGGRSNGLKKLRETYNKRSKYAKNRNLLTFETSRLSAYIKFGCVSIREVYYKMKSSKKFIDQLFWREFYYYIVYYFPEMLKGKSFRNIKSIAWKNNTRLFNKWKNGETGFPVVDAAMKELNTTGYQHNRGRLITSNFLHRLLHIDWRKGEMYFANMLTDYDPSVNNGNWQWSASVGVDTKPYSQRVFNPILQSKRYDPKAEYIKKWLPNLSEVPAKHLHDWEKYHNLHDLDELEYFKPVINYKKARKKSLQMYKRAFT